MIIKVLTKKFFKPNMRDQNRINQLLTKCEFSNCIFNKKLFKTEQLFLIIITFTKISMSPKIMNILIYFVFTTEIVLKFTFENNFKKNLKFVDLKFT